MHNRLFAQQIVCTTGASIEQREAAQRLVERHGGRYSLDLRVGETTILVVYKARSDKHTYATARGIQCVRETFLEYIEQHGAVPRIEDHQVPQLHKMRIGCIMPNGDAKNVIKRAIENSHGIFIDGIENCDVTIEISENTEGAVPINACNDGQLLYFRIQHNRRGRLAH